MSYAGLTNVCLETVMRSSAAFTVLPENPLTVADQVEAGLSFSVFSDAKHSLALTDADLAEVLDISTRTLHRLSHTPDARFSLSVGDRLSRLLRIADFAMEVLGSSKRVQDWLREPQFGLGMRTPLHLLRTDAGTQEVWDLLGRIQYGVYA